MSDIKENQYVKLEPSALLTFFELDLTPIFDFARGAVQKHFYFHAYPVRPSDSNASEEADKNQGVLLWQGNKYYPIPITTDGFELNTQGSLPRPIIRIANIIPFLKDLTRVMNGLTGAKIIRRRVFYKYLDNLPEANDNAGFNAETYIINRKKSETKTFIEFELMTPIELGDIKLPRRQIVTNTCTWCYRKEGCEYAGNTITDVNDTYYGEVGVDLVDKGEWQPDINYSINDVVWILINNVPYYYMAKINHVSSYRNKFSNNYWVADECSKTIKGCKKRFPNTALPFGGFPATNMT